MRLGIFGAIVLIVMFGAPPAAADYQVDFLRITCVPEAGFFEIEHHSVHNNPAAEAPEEAWARQGLYAPSGKERECKLKGVTYKVVAEQAGPRAAGMCAAAPDMIVSVLRNDVVMLDKVVFGFSCFGNPTITRVSRTEAKKGYFGAEAEVCLLEGGDESDKPVCEWFFDDLNTLEGVFPLRQESLGTQLLNRKEQ